MKITIVDDEWACELGDILSESGHEVQIIDPSAYDTCEEICSEISDFGPDVLLVDHDIQRAFTGADIVRFLKYPATKCVGIDSSFEDQEQYCDQFFTAKTVLETVDGAPERLLRLVSEVG